MNWKQKLSSRKLWACIVGVGMGIAIAFGLDESTITTVAGAVTSLISVVTYVLAEEDRRGSGQPGVHRHLHHHRGAGGSVEE